MSVAPSATPHNRPSRTQVVITCANRKTRPVPAPLRLGQLAPLKPGQRVEAWVKRLQSAEEPALRACDLYAGEHWQVARHLPVMAESTDWHTTLWVCSAGYGLVSADAPLRPYAATFSPRHVDSVGSRAELGDWWQGLSAWPGPVPGAPRSLVDLARADPHATLLVALSPPYLEACAEDLLAAAAILASPEQFTIISVGAPRRGTLGAHIAPGDARLQHALGGTRQALNARVIAYLLGQRTHPLTRSAIAHTLDRLLASQPPLPQYHRDPQSDAQVTAFIRQRLSINPRLTHSRLLRELRDAGRACEQGRFAALFRAVQEEV
jgi:hypothetical protein